MCGILCLISRDFERHPFDFSDEFSCQSRVEIRNRFYEEPVISKTGVNKLKNQDLLRMLNNEATKLGNNIKVDNSERIAQIQAQIKEIIGEDFTSSETTLSPVQEFESLIPDIARRGPDSVEYRQLSVASRNIQVFSSVLSLRQPFSIQPIVSERFLLQFNGELYNSQCKHNDTVFLMDQIKNKGVVEAVKGIKGEFAFSLVDLESHLVYFGRDSVGKRSLCYKHTDSQTDSIIISSVSMPGCTECDAGTIYCFDLKTSQLSCVHKREPYAPITDLYLGDDVSGKCEVIYAALKQACFLRQETISPLYSTEADLAVLFSGGIDCTVIAALLMENFIETKEGPINIDLLTVGFDSPRTQLPAHRSPDRELSQKSWFHLAKKYHHPNISLRLVEINIDYEQWLTHKAKVKALMYPQQTEMDLSIAIAFYFASNNIITSKKIELVDHSVDWDTFLANRDAYITTDDYISSSKVLFSGLGADELFAGYSRHEALFSGVKPEDDPQPQYLELTKLLHHDIEVIDKRNLGRDDRVIGGWGKELRYPYLDTDFITTVMEEIEPNLKIKLEWSTTKKGKVVTKPIRKWILRQMAGNMGLDFVKDEIKRAIQFGAKSAKLEIGQSKAKGTDEL